MADRNLYANNTSGRGGESRVRKVLGVRNAPTLPSDVAVNRTLGLCIAPAGFVVTGYSLTITDIDTNGTPTHAFIIGDAADTDRLATTATTGQAGGTLTTLAATGLNYQFPTDTEVFMTSTVGAATAVAGTVTFNLEGYIE